MEKQQPPLEESIDELSNTSVCALLVVDVQNDFAHEHGKGARIGANIVAAQSAIKNINILIQTARKVDIPIVYIRTEHSELVDRPNFIARYRKRGFDSTDLLCATGSWGAKLFDDLLPPKEGDAVIIKHGYDGFQETPLDAILQNRGAKILVVTGLITNLCVQTTAEHGFALGYFIVIAGDATSSNKKTTHKAALRNLADYFGIVSKTNEIVEAWHDK